MKIVIAPDSFKGSNSAAAVAGCIERGILKVFPDAEIASVPIADGGEGTVEAVVVGGNGEYHDVTVTGPLGNRVTARYGLLEGQKAVIEMVQNSCNRLAEQLGKNLPDKQIGGISQKMRQLQRDLFAACRALS